MGNEFHGFVIVSVNPDFIRIEKIHKFQCEENNPIENRIYGCGTPRKS
jgi:hypothetical protein